VPPPGISPNYLFIKVIFLIPGTLTGALGRVGKPTRPLPLSGTRHGAARPLEAGARRNGSLASSIPMASAAACGLLLAFADLHRRLPGRLQPSALVLSRGRAPGMNFAFLAIDLL